MTDPETKPASILLADLVENNRNALLERWTQTIERTLAPKPLTQLDLLNRIRSRFSTRDDGETVLLEVKNQGPPLPADEIPSLFEPFQRGSNAQPETGSLGLGLLSQSKSFSHTLARSRSRPPPRKEPYLPSFGPAEAW